MRSRARGFLLALGLAGASLGQSATAVLPRMLLLDGAVVGHDIVAVGERGTALYSSDQARTWQLAAVPGGMTLTGVSFAPGTPLGWAVGHLGAIVASTDGGRSWQAAHRSKDEQDSFLDVLALDAQHVIAVGAYALYLETKDGGKTWAKRKIGTEDFHFNRLSRGPGGTLYLAGEHGTLLKSPDAGATWTPIAAPYDGSFYGVLPLAPRTLLAYGLRGHVFRSTDDGASWSSIATPQPAVLATAVQSPRGAILLAGSAGTLLVSRDEGMTFAAAAGAAKAIAELIALPDGNLLALGESGANVIDAGRVLAPAPSTPR